MSDLYDNFWSGFTGELDKIAAAKWKTMLRSGKLSQKSVRRLGSAAGVAPSRITKQRLGFSGEVSRGLGKSRHSVQNNPGLPVSGPKPKLPKPSVPASAGPSSSTAGASKPPKAPPAPKETGASPVAAPPTPARGAAASAVEGASQMLPYMLMSGGGGQQKYKPQAVHVRGGTGMYG